jgi:hypothetical protein
VWTKIAMLASAHVAVTSHSDSQARDQAVMVAKRQQIDWDEITDWAAAEGIGSQMIAEIRAGCCRLKFCVPS